MAINTYKTYLMKGSGSPTTSYSKLVDIKDFSDIFGAPETLETTTLSDAARTYILGIQEQEPLTFTCNYTKTDFTTLKALEDTETDFGVFFGSTTTSGATDGYYTFKGYLGVTINGGGVNEVVDMTVTIAPTTVITAH